MQYSVNDIPNATNYTWTVPIGSTITAGQGTTTITITWGPIVGPICVIADIGGCASAQYCQSFDIGSKQPVPKPIKRLN